MDSIKPSPSPTRSKLSKTFRKVINLKKSQKNRCFKPNTKQLERESEAEAMEASQNRAVLAKLFAAVSSIKAAYAELQTAQLPYDNAAVQSADQSVVDELKSISELKRMFMKNQIDSSPPHVTLLLAEIQEQQSLMRIYEITMKKMQDQIGNGERKISFLKEDLKVIIQNNRGMERKLNASGPFSVLDGVRFSDLNPNYFNLVLNYALRSVRNFVRCFIREMERANWDIQAAANSAQPDINFSKKDHHKAFAFESFVCREIFRGFNDPNFSIQRDDQFILPGEIYQRRVFFFEQFEKLRSASLIEFLRRNPNSLFGKFVKSKFLAFVHPKMEFSFFGNLNQRKTVMSSGEWPETEFFKVFAEMSRRVWLLHCLAFSFEQEVEIFQVEKNSKFSEVYMESVENDIFAPGSTDGEFRVAFTVVPGFKLHRTVVQSKVYLFPTSKLEV
ncbi:hypothetical protein CASFOL_040806 [Castilleja foliolosa]|uniref:DUF641 domain-containing protein n=1 Tax=Castilleja foliolosa TaxID=1961234 RepID=A0ABD3BE91_9LAMI